MGPLSAQSPRPCRQHLSREDNGLLGAQSPRPHRRHPSRIGMGPLVRLFLFGESQESQTPNTHFLILMGYEIKYPNCASGENGVKSESYLFLIKLLMI